MNETGEIRAQGNARRTRIVTQSQKRSAVGEFAASDESCVSLCQRIAPWRRPIKRPCGQLDTAPGGNWQLSSLGTKGGSCQARASSAANAGLAEGCAACGLLYIIEL